MNTYSQDGALILKDGVVLTTTETVDLLNKLQKVADKWDKLDAKIGKFYQEPEYDYEDDWEYDDADGDLCSIGEIAAMAFKYL